MAPKKSPKEGGHKDQSKEKGKIQDEKKKAKEKKEEPAKEVKTVKEKEKAKPSKSGIAGVFIKNLDFPGMNIDTVKETFSGYPKISEVRLRHGKYVLIFFESLQTAQKCVGDLNGKTVKGNKVTVELLRRAKPTPNRADFCTTVFVGNLGGRTTIDQLYKHFSSCGTITKVRVFNPRLHGFVYFADNASARKAVAMAEAPFSYGKDVAVANPPKQAQYKLDIRYSIRTKEFDKNRNKKRFSRAPPSRIKDREEKNASRAKKRALLKKQQKKKPNAEAAAKTSEKPQAKGGKK